MPFKLLEIPPCINFQFGEQLRSHIWLPFLFLLSLQPSHFQIEEHRPSRWFCSFSPDSQGREQKYMKYFLWFVELDLKIQVHICWTCSGALHMDERMRWNERLGVVCLFSSPLRQIVFHLCAGAGLLARWCSRLLSIAPTQHASGNWEQAEHHTGIAILLLFYLLSNLGPITQPHEAFVSIWEVRNHSTHLSEWMRRFGRIPWPASPAGGKVVPQGIGLLISF